MSALKMALSHMIGKPTPTPAPARKHKRKKKKPRRKKTKRHFARKKSKLNLSSRALRGLKGLA